jgi:VPDSG-CTERM motif
MKTQKKNDRGLCLQARNNRWKWMAGATAATAAGVTASQASTITINLVGNYISGSGGNHLNADLTGDGQPDLTIAGAYYHFRSTPSISAFHTFGTAGAHLNGVVAFAFHSGQYPLGTVQLGSKTGHWAAGSGTPSLHGSIPITFKDLNINNGALTQGSLAVTVTIFGAHGPAEIDLNSLTYTRNSVPDQGSTLALLAMGASGVLAFRRWRDAQGLS